MDAGWLVAVGLMSSMAGAFVHWLFSRDNCASCGIIELKSKIESQSKLIRAIAEKAGMTVPEQLEIEAS